MADETAPTKEEAAEKDVSFAAADYLRKLGYETDNGGPLYFLALGKFLDGASEEEKKASMTPQGLILVLRKRLDKKLNAEVSTSSVPWLAIGIFGVALLGAFWYMKDKE